MAGAVLDFVNGFLVLLSQKMSQKAAAWVGVD